MKKQDDSIGSMPELVPPAIGEVLEPTELIGAPVEEQQPQITPEETLKKLHGGRNLHFGARRTWLLLNKQFARWISSSQL